MIHTQFDTPFASYSPPTVPRGPRTDRPDRPSDRSGGGDPA